MVGEHEQAEAIAGRIVSLEPGRVSGETRLVEGLPALEARLRLHDMVGEHEQAEAIAGRIVSLEPGRVSGETRLVEGL
ncbi:hypothetical protein C7E25_24295, partial [Stenotrophomonas maltophilia]